MPDLVARRGDFEDWIAQGLGLPQTASRVVDVTNGGKLPPPVEVNGVVISGSHAMVTEHHAWSESTAQWLRDAVQTGVPILGICYGHQLLAYALGGEVGDNPNGREFGTVDIHLYANGDPLLTGFGSPIQTHVSHTQSADIACRRACPRRKRDGAARRRRLCPARLGRAISPRIRRRHRAHLHPRLRRCPPRRRPGSRAASGDVLRHTIGSEALATIRTIGTTIQAILSRTILKGGAYR